MRKKLLIVLLLIFSFTGGVYAQKLEKLSFTEYRSDGTLIGNVTVNAIFIGWSQQNISLEGNLLVIYERYCTKGSSDWTDWELTSKQPRLTPLSLSEIYNIRLRAFSVRPREAIRSYIDNVQVVRIPTIPNRQSSPYSWSKDGMSFNVMYEIWAIIP
jgi:hypothetical protein